MSEIPPSNSSSIFSYICCCCRKNTAKTDSVTSKTPLMKDTIAPAEHPVVTPGTPPPTLTSAPATSTPLSPFTQYKQQEAKHMEDCREVLLDDE